MKEAKRPPNKCNQMWSSRTSCINECIPLRTAADNMGTSVESCSSLRICLDLSGSVWICLDLRYLNLDPLEIITQFGSLHACMPSDLWRKSLNLLYLPRGVL